MRKGVRGCIWECASTRKPVHLEICQRTQMVAKTSRGQARQCLDLSKHPPYGARSQIPAPSTHTRTRTHAHARKIETNTKKEEANQCGMRATQTGTNTYTSQETTEQPPSPHTHAPHVALHRPLASLQVQAGVTTSWSVLQQQLVGQTAPRHATSHRIASHRITTYWEHRRDQMHNGAYVSCSQWRACHR
jgi:hypothetical protein